MIIRSGKRLNESDVTPETVYKKRRTLLKLAGLSALSGITGVACGDQSPAQPPRAKSQPVSDAHQKWDNLAQSRFSIDAEPNSFEDATTYNNFYEFGTGKEDPSRYAGSLITDPWSVTVSGACDNPGTFALDDLLSGVTLEERIYRLRCVEAWSMVIPWVGFPIAQLLKRFQPTSAAKFVRFTTLFDPKQMPGQKRAVLDWPYVEGLTIEEAMHPLAIFAVGLYGKPMPNQNGAPLRLVVPWKYGFKSIKSIVGIEFTDQRPLTSWEKAAPSEYGFYANVNPNVDHPRWSQASERVIGTGIFAERRPTDMFNGYADEVGSLYSGLDLRTNF